MCGESNKHHTILGQRTNQSQGFRPKKNIGISVSIQKCTNCNLIYSNPQPIPFDIQDHYGTLRRLNSTHFSKENGFGATFIFTITKPFN